jgi:hypothetical protein
MAEIRYVILSDLHFGAENSVLTSVVEGPAGTYRVDPTTASPLLVAMVAGLRHLTAGQSEPPTLILAGDVLDLALSPDAVAGAAFEGFVDLAFGPAPADGAEVGTGRIFAPAVYYLPGNHDHHLWEGAREAQYISYLRQLAPGLPLDPPWHTTRLLPEQQPPWTTHDLMSSLIQRRPGCADVAVRIMYPDMALRTPDGDRLRIISHGHFTESIYTLMSRLRQLLFPNQGAGAPSPSMARLEEENFAWIDFFWSTLGRSGAVGADVGLIYADMSSAADLNALAGNLVAGLFLKSHAPRWLRRVESTLATAVFRNEVRHMARSERGTPDVTLSPQSRLALRSYLEGPLHRQIQEDIGGVPTDVGFIFGHTHKPFVEDWTLAGYPGSVRISNTGGWVVDTADPALTQGGVAVLLDDDLNMASLEFYRQTADGRTAPVQLLKPSGDAQGAGAGAHTQALASSLEPTEEPWAAVSIAAAELVAERHRLQSTIVRAGVR